MEPRVVHHAREVQNTVDPARFRARLADDLREEGAVRDVAGEGEDLGAGGAQPSEFLGGPVPSRPGGTVGAPPSGRFRPMRTIDVSGTSAIRRASARPIAPKPPVIT